MVYGAVRIRLCLFACQMEKLVEFSSAVCSYHVFKDVWKPSIGDDYSSLKGSLRTSSTNLPS